jgi:hypothetical protein
MPHFTLQLTNPGGPIVDAFVGLSHARVTALLAAKQPVPSAVRLRALVDTGASCTCFDPGALVSLGPFPTGVTQVLTPSTGTAPHQASTYDVNITIPCGNLMPLVVGNLAIIESNLAVQGIQALFGRDILSRCMLVYNGQNDFSRSPTDRRPVSNWESSHWHATARSRPAKSDRPRGTERTREEAFSHAKSRTGPFDLQTLPFRASTSSRPGSRLDLAPGTSRMTDGHILLERPNITGFLMELPSSSTKRTFMRFRRFAAFLALTLR